MKTKPVTKIPFQARQGDVLIERIDTTKTTSGKDARKRGRVILAEGEVTGHCHEVIGDDIDFIRPDAAAKDYEFLLTLGRDALVEHPDHRPEIPLPRAAYKVIPQMQYTPQAIQRDRD